MRVVTKRRALILWLIFVAATSAALLILVALDQATVADAVSQLAITSVCAGAAIGAIAALQAWLSRRASRDG